MKQEGNLIEHSYCTYPPAWHFQFILYGRFARVILVWKLEWRKSWEGSQMNVETSGVRQTLKSCDICHKHFRNEQCWCFLMDSVHTCALYSCTCFQTFDQIYVAITELTSIDEHVCAFILKARSANPLSAPRVYKELIFTDGPLLWRMCS